MAAPDELRSSPKAQAWFCTTGLPSDVIVEVDDMSFHLHKFPLMSKSKKLQQLIAEQETVTDHEITDEMDDLEKLHVSLPDLPGGAEAFEIAAKFCYGVRIDLTASNAVPVRCAAEYLEMTDEISHDNLAARSDRFITQTIGRSVRDSVRALRSCDGALLPAAEALGIVQRCIDSIAVRASSADLTSLFSWPMHEDLVDRISSDPKKLRRKGASNSVAKAVFSESWIDELTALSLPTYSRVIAAMKARDLSSEVIESALITYAMKSIPGLSRSGRKSTGGSLLPEPDQIELLEMVIANLPQTKSTGPASTRLLFGMLRAVNILNGSDASRDVLEKKIGLQLEQVMLDDLLMPSYSHASETLYDVDCVERLLGYFQEGMGSNAVAEEEEEVVASIGQSPQMVGPLMAVGKLIDRYLSEIATDVNLKAEKFCSLAFVLPEQARIYDDGLYRAVDVYLKAHPNLSEAEREKLCGVMDCQKLTLEACTHAAQNERLPLRAVVQVLFFEQLQLRHAIAGSLVDGSNHQPGSSGIAWNGTTGRRDIISTWRQGAPDNQLLRLDMDSMRSRVQELERECSTIKKAIEKMDRNPSTGRRSSLSRKFGCKFRTQVCDSHERAIVDPRRHRGPEEQSA